MISGFNKAPSIMTDATESTWSINIGVPICGFCMDDFQDLVVVMTTSHQSPRRDIHFLSMQTGNPHADAKSSLVSEEIAEIQPRDCGCRIEIHGERVAIHFKGATLPEVADSTSVVIIWNWKTGERLARLGSDEGALFNSFCFLSPSHLLVGRRIGPEYAATFAWLEVHDFSKGPEHIAIHRFQLPQPQSNIILSGFKILSEVAPTVSSRAWRPFYTSPANRICMIQVEYEIMSMNQSVNYIVFASTFLGLLPKAESPSESAEGGDFLCASTVPWKDWSPHACIMVEEPSPGLDKVVTCGTRIVRLLDTSNWFRYQIQILDFNPYASSQVKGVVGSKDNEKPPKARQPLEYEDRCPKSTAVTHEYVEPHVIFESIFENPVFSALPYLATTTVETFPIDDVMVDFENIYLTNPHGIRVLSF